MLLSEQGTDFRVQLSDIKTTHLPTKVKFTDNFDNKSRPSVPDFPSKSVKSHLGNEQLFEGYGMIINENANNKSRQALQTVLNSQN